MNDYECEAQNNRLKIGFLSGIMAKTITNCCALPENTQKKLSLVQQQLSASGLHRTHRLMSFVLLLP